MPSSAVDVKFSDGELEALKYLALLFMIADHVNKYLFNGTLPYCYEVGRLALPLFAFILGYNCARANISSISLLKVVKRLFIFGILATPPHAYLGNIYAIWPLNILFTLAASVLVIYLLVEERAITGLLVFLIAGFFVEFFHVGVLLPIASYYLFKTKQLRFLFLIVFCLLSLTFINNNYYALSSLIVVFLFKPLNINYTRPKWSKWLFYYFYPVHLIAFIIIRIPMREAGYLFFT